MGRDEEKAGTPPPPEHSATGLEGPSDAETKIDPGKEAIQNGQGDRPRVSRGQGRKSKACLECKKLKIRCDIFPGDRKCRHCLRRKLHCVFNRTYVAQLQDEEPKSGSIVGEMQSLHERLRQMQSTLDAVLVRCTPGGGGGASDYSPESGAPGHAPSVSMAAAPASEYSRERNMQMAMTRENSTEPMLHDANDPVSLEEPMGSLYEVTRLRNLRSNKSKTSKASPSTRNELDDFITRGAITEAEANSLYNTFISSLSHYVWIGLEEIHASFTSIRQSSELLAATILTVTALHLPSAGPTFSTCYKEFLSLISGSMFSRYHSIDDVRGLCIASFWLSDVSWSLSGHAIRIATELGIHQSFARALNGDREHFLRARLWYMLYVCDHHFSIAYGRPPVVAESAQIRETELFLASPHASVIDARILSQVSLMQVLTRVYGQFSEVRLPDLASVRAGGSGARQADEASAAMLSEADLQSLSAYNLEIDQWRMRWYPRQPPSPYIGDFPRRGVVLYSHFAKLQINSLAARGVSRASGWASAERRDLANQAVSAAVNILTLLLDEEDMRKSLVGTPLYVHTMVAFSSVFLLKAVTRLDRLMGLNVDYGFVLKLLRRLVMLLREAVTSERHMLKHLASGLEKMLRRVPAAREAENDGAVDGIHATPAIPEWQQQQQQQQQQQPGMVGHHHEQSLNGHGGEGTPMETSSDPNGLVARAHQHQDWEMSRSVPSQPEHEAMDPWLFGGGEGVSGISDAVAYDAFGLGSANDVFNLLTTQYPF